MPRPLGVAREQAGLALARELLPGMPLDPRVGRQAGIEPWDVVAEIAAEIHRIDVARLPDGIPGHATRREHALAELEAFDGLAPVEAREAHAWALDHLPPDEPASLLHGDLLGQNILLDPFRELPPAVIDWEYAVRGDPAYDLAIVTRGVRHPFQVGAGLSLLLERYVASGGGRVREEHVRLHELALAGRWYREALARPPGEGHSPQESLAMIRRVLKMAGA